MFEIIPMNHKNHVSAYNPFRDMDSLEKSLWGTFNPFFAEDSKLPFKTDIHEKDNTYVLEADMPGFQKSDINVDIDGDYLTIKAERHSEHEDKDKKESYVRCERSYGCYTRSFDITGIDTENISAKYDNGVLTLTMPKKEPIAPEAKKLTIQ